MDELLQQLYEEEKQQNQKAEKRNLAKLMPGTVLFYDSGFHHSYMYLGSLYGVEHCRVHARSAEQPYGIYVDGMPDGVTLKPATSAYACMNRDLTAQAVNFARAWALFDPNLFQGTGGVNWWNVVMPATTPFSFERYGNLVDSGGSADPFSAASLRRALKYASRRGQPLSRNKGMTCTAYLIACFQAAFFWLLSKGNTSALGKACETLTVKIKKNEELDEAEVDADDAWQLVAGLLTDSEKPITELLPPALLLESKTTNAGKPWKKRIEADEGWKRIGLEQV